MNDPKTKAEVLPPVPKIPDLMLDHKPTVTVAMTFQTHADHATAGLLDPAHGPFVHQNWWWRTKSSIHEKSKAFAPSHLGFTMRRHRPSKNSFAYKILGGTPETEISFQLPAIRIEHIRAGKTIIGNMTCVTPVDDNTTEVTNLIYTNNVWLKLFAPLIKIFGIGFLGQDREIVRKQRAGLKHNPPLMLVRDADTQSRWYQQIKNEFLRAQAENRTFNNPVKETVLRWRT
jgi:phenylpropionate dioxygenase-like ring-hydroxylating dioxygenase large terminal subunit